MENEKNEFENKYQITPKGIAIMAAIESELLPEIEGGWDDSKFNIFWEKFENSLKERGYSIFKVSKDRYD